MYKSIEILINKGHILFLLLIDIKRDPSGYSIFRMEGDEKILLFSSTKSETMIAKLENMTKNIGFAIFYVSPVALDGKRAKAITCGRGSMLNLIKEYTYEPSIPIDEKSSWKCSLI